MQSFVRPIFYDLTSKKPIFKKLISKKQTSNEQTSAQPSSEKPTSKEPTSQKSRDLLKNGLSTPQETKPPSCQKVFTRLHTGQKGRTGKRRGENSNTAQNSSSEFSRYCYAGNRISEKTPSETVRKVSIDLKLTPDKPVNCNKGI